MTASDTLCGRVLPSYEENCVEVEPVLTGDRRGRCSRPLRHFYELFPVLNQFEKRRNEIRSPDTNGFCERCHRTFDAEFFAMASSRTVSESFDHLEADPGRDSNSTTARAFD